MADEGATSNVFDVPQDDLFQEELAEIEQEAPAEPTAEAQVEPEEPQPEPEAPETEEEETTEAPEEQPPELILGRFKSVEDLQSAYRNLEGRFTELGQETAQERRAREELENALRQAAPALKAFFDQQRQVPEDFDPSDPAAIQRVIDQRVAQQMQTIEAQQAQAQQQATIEAQRHAIESWEAAQADLTPEIAGEIKGIFDDYRYDPETNQETLPVTKENLDLAKTLASNPQARHLLRVHNLFPDPEYVKAAVEASGNESLYEVVMANPLAMETPQGMAWARKAAGMPEVVAQAQSKAQEAQARNQQAQRNAAYVETGGTQATPDAPGRKPADALEAFVDEYEAMRSKSVFGD